MVYFPRNKYRAVRKLSELCKREFDSKAEARRGEELWLLEQADVIDDLQYQVSFTLCKKPSIKIKIDFVYWLDGKPIYEDRKGMGETREFRVKRAWLQEQQGIDIWVTKDLSK